MKTFVKCEICNADIPTDHCVFVAHKRVIDGKEHVFCCVRCTKVFEKKKK